MSRRIRDNGKDYKGEEMQAKSRMKNTDAGEVEAENTELDPSVI